MVQLLGFFSVSPAPAGMIPLLIRGSFERIGDPRTRGDDPVRGLPKETDMG